MCLHTVTTHVYTARWSLACVSPKQGSAVLRVLAAHGSTSSPPATSRAPSAAGAFSQLRLPWQVPLAHPLFVAVIIA